MRTASLRSNVEFFTCLRYTVTMGTPGPAFGRSNLGSPHHQRHAVRWRARPGVGLRTVLFFAPLWFANCQQDACGTDFVMVDGACMPRCDPDTCGDGLFCVRNVCRPQCTAGNDCLGDDTCRAVQSDDGRLGRYCYGPAVSVSPYEEREHGETEAGTPLPAACDTDEDCTRGSARHCVNDTCKTLCLHHAHCEPAGVCTGTGTTSDGTSVAFCERDSFERGMGQYGSRCSAPNSCDSEAGFVCISAGEGDTDSYCTKPACTEEADCPSGYTCSETREPRLPCSADCGLPAAPPGEDCIAADEIGAGKIYQCDSTAGLVLRVCLQRDFCNECETDADCAARPGQLCARGPDGVKHCTVLCSPGAGSCPWGASTTCEVFDEELGQPTCGHRFGSCRGDGSSCTPCTDDGDCPRGFCTGSSFSGERFCFDEEAACVCDPGVGNCSGGGCPLTPGGLEMNCVPRTTGAPPSVCFGGFTSGASRLGCWL